MTSSQVLIAGTGVVIIAIVLGVALTLLRSRGDDEIATAPANRDAAPLSADPEDEETNPLLWAQLTTGDNGPLGVNDRIDMIARLEMVGEKWCIDALRSAFERDPDEQVKAAARDALLRLTATANP